MEPFTILEGIAAPIEQPNVDTGQILPARFLRRPRGEGYQHFLFRDLRFRPDGSEDPGFILNQAPYRAARILVAGRNFGAGSSREQAVWGLTDYGIRCVVAVDFGDIFQANCCNAGLLPVRLPAAACEKLRQQLHADPGASLRVDLPAQTVTGPDASRYSFEIDGARKLRMLEGVDDIAATLRHEAALAAFEQAYRARFDWLFDFPQAGAS